MPEYQLTFLRSMFSFFILLIICRILGKQQLSQLTFFDYIVGITIGSIAASLSVDQNIKISNGIMSLIVWGLFPMLMAYLSMKSRIFSNIVAGKPAVLIENGKINEKSIKKAKLSLGQLMLNLRENKAFKISDVELAVFETNGKISVMKKSDLDPITPKILGMQVEKEKRQYIVIQDGKVIDKTLETSGYSKEWLYGEIQKQGAKDFKDVYAAQIDSKGNLYVDLFNDQKSETPSNARLIVRAQLNKVKADLDVFSLDTNNESAKSMFASQAKMIQSMQKNLNPLLK